VSLRSPWCSFVSVSHHPGVSVPAVPKPCFTLVPFDAANGPSGCPSHLMHTSEDGVTSPIELVSGAFSLLEDVAFQCVFVILAPLA